MKNRIDSPRFSEEPEVSKPEVFFFFSAHGSPEDYSGIKKAFDGADVIVLESHGWNQGELDLLRDIANGSKIPKHLQEGRTAVDVSEYEEELLYKSGKRVEIIDVPEGNELADEDDGTEQFSEIAQRFIAQGNLSEALNSLQDAAKINAEYIRRKDQFIEEQLKRLLEHVGKESKDSKVLVQMGSTHTGISHDLLKDKSARRVDNEVLFDFTDELVRAYRFGYRPQEDLVIKALIEQLIKGLFLSELVRIPYLQRAKFFRSTFKNITKEQIEELGQTMESKWFQDVVMNGKENTNELSKEILDDAWDMVFGSHINRLMQEALTTS